MSDLTQRLAELSPERRRLLELRLRKRGISLSGEQVITRRQTDGPCALSFAQERLWFLEQLQPGGTAYNLVDAYRLVGPLNLKALEKSLNELVRRHEILRTTYSAVDGDPVQIVAPSLNLAVPIVELRHLPEADREAAVRRLANDEAMQPFDLVAGPILRTRLLQIEEQEHVLLVTIHHIASDAWSTSVLFQEISTLYDAFDAGRPSPLPELAIQYADYAVWQRQWLQGEMLERRLAYWQEQLEGAPPVAVLATDRPRSSAHMPRGRMESAGLSETVSEGLRALSRSEGATLFMTVLAAFKVLLYRLTGETDIRVGSPTASRNRAEIEDLIGFFVNTLILRTDLSGKPTFRELLGRVRTVAIGAYAHQDLPFEKLVVALNPERDLSHTPLFQILFNMLNVDDTEFALTGLATKPVELDEVPPRFDLTVYVREQQGTIDLQMLYDQNLFNPDRVNTLLLQFRRLLEEIVAAPDKPIDSYSLVIPESQSILPDPTVALEEPEQVPLTSMIAHWADEAPEHPAITQNGRPWSYAELISCAESIARSLRITGLQRGEVAAITGTPSFGLIAGMLGVWMNGSVLLTIDPALPSPRQELMLREAGARIVMDASAKSGQDSAWQGDWPLDRLLLDPATGHIEGLSDEAALDSGPLPEPEPEDAAYVFFTSGTTGIPKGVLGSHRGLSHFLAWQRDTFAIGPEDRAAQLTGLSFDVVLRDIFTPLASGATLCLPRQTDLSEPASLVKWLEQERITLMHTVPSLARFWLAHVPAGASLSAMRCVFFAGEPLTDALVSQWRDAFSGGGEIVNLYGPTETTLAKCYYRVPANPSHGVQPVGKPLPQTQALVLTEGNMLCGVGEPGEIVIRTPFRSLGYVNDSAGNNKRFAKNPFRDDERDLLYFTGDRGRYRPDGMLEILGRLDDQVKVLGVRVELGEVAATLDRHPAVKDCVVVASQDEQGETRLAAYVVLSGEADVSGGQLGAFLSQHLPAAMVPAAMVFLEQLPLTPNGKVDRRALPAPDWSTHALEKGFLAPRTPVEEQLASIWSQVLGVERVGIQDSFFELGGHSLIALRLVSRVRDAFHVELPLLSLFESPTVGGMADLVEAARWAARPESGEDHDDSGQEEGVL